jgi:putative OPT family oligopeptide transporter
MSEQPRYRPFVPQNMQMREFTLRALLLGLVMTVILGAANAYLGLRAGITIAATYPAAVIGMAVLRLVNGSVLEENIARTAGSIGESVAAGAIFTLPAFLIAGAWPSFAPKDAYWKSTSLMVVGSILGVLFVSLVRRVMVEDPDLPFPESVAASEIHKAGRRGADAAKFLFYNLGLGALIQFLAEIQLFANDKDFILRVGTLGKSVVKLGSPQQALNAGGVTLASGPTVSPAYIGVGYIIGPELASLNFAGGVLAWGFLIPLLIFFMGPQLRTFLPAGSTDDSWIGLINSVWRYIVRPIAVGGMMTGAAYTLFRMRKGLFDGLKRAVSDLSAAKPQESIRTDQYMSSKVVFALIAVMFACMIALYIYLSNQVLGGIVAASVMLLIAFFFAAVSGYLVGTIGSTNNPISGLTLTTLIIAALLMVSLGVSGPGGVAVVLGVAAVGCVSSAVAGELLQDFKVGYILGGTPRRIQMAELIAVVVASAAMYWPLYILQAANIKGGGIGFGDPKLSAPQAGLMATLAQGIVGGDMPWPLVVVGVMFGLVMIMSRVKSPMLVAVGMYLPINTTFAIFVGGVFRWVTDSMRKRAGLNEAQSARVENVGILTASGLIAGEALMGLVVATFRFFEWPLPDIFCGNQARPYCLSHTDPSYIAGSIVILLLGTLLVRLPLSKAGSPDEPAPPVAMM